MKSLQETYSINSALSSILFFYLDSGGEAVLLSPDKLKSERQGKLIKGVRREENGKLKANEAYN